MLMVDFYYSSIKTIPLRINTRKRRKGLAKSENLLIIGRHNRGIAKLVRHQVLILTSVGSSPATPAIF